MERRDKKKWLAYTNKHIQTSKEKTGEATIIIYLPLTIHSKAKMSALFPDMH